MINNVKSILNRIKKNPGEILTPTLHFVIKNRMRRDADFTKKLYRE